ncbi:hypothetical protein FQ330_03180 [Agrococcus sediminis]|uniref:Uncharacterized protein n=1 Tax=Agrococcus sediminis TaxID=2599924 RepID=A0A5M8QMK3_9MICO|nr:hypothetical protein [Agrococcus sediminis]KAA6436421.1 hypothetical protein FQ330_03180 [Agrococcus sediminis]
MKKHGEQSDEAKEHEAAYQEAVTKHGEQSAEAREHQVAHRAAVRKHGEQSAEAKKLLPALRTSETAYTKRRKELELRAVWSREEFLRERDTFLDDVVLVDDEGEPQRDEAGNTIPMTDLNQLHPQHQAAKVQKWEELSIFLAAYDRLAQPENEEEFGARREEAQLAAWVESFFRSVSRTDRPSDTPSRPMLPTRNEDVLAMVAYIEREQKPEKVTPPTTEKQALMRAKAEENRAKIAELIVAAVNEAQERLAAGLEFTAVAEEALLKREAAAAIQVEHDAAAAARAVEKPKAKKSVKQVKPVASTAPDAVEQTDEADTIDAAAQVLDLLHSSRKKAAEVVEEVEPADEEEAQVEEQTTRIAPPPLMPRSQPRPQLPPRPAPMAPAAEEEIASQPKVPLPTAAAPAKPPVPTAAAAVTTARQMPPPPRPAAQEEHEETLLEKFLKRMGLKS